MTLVTTPVSRAALDLIGYVTGDDSLVGAAAQLLAPLDDAGFVFEGYEAQATPAGTLIRLRLPAPAPTVTLPASTLPQITFTAGVGEVGESLTIEVLEHPRGEWLELRHLYLAIAIDPLMLVPLDPQRSTVDVTFTAGVRLTRNGAVTILPDLRLDLPPSEIPGTGIAVALQGLHFDITAGHSVDALVALGRGPEFRGLYAEQGWLRLLPMVRFGDIAGLTLDARDIILGEAGVSASLRLTYLLEHDGQAIGSDSELAGELLTADFPVALQSIELDLQDSIPSRFAVEAVVRVPLLELLLDAEIGMSWRPALGAYGYTLVLRSLAPALIPLAHGQLSFDSLTINGDLDTEGFDLSGIVGGVRLDLDPFDLTLGGAEFRLLHDQHVDEIRVRLGALTLGPVGEVENAELMVRRRQRDGQFETDVRIEAAVAWQDLDLANRFGITVPDHFPTLPDSGQVTLFLSWDEDLASGQRTLTLRFAAELQDVHSLWPYIPPPWRPEVRHFRMAFEATYPSGADFGAGQPGDTFANGSLSAELSLRLPPLPEFPGGELLTIDSGDEQGWIEARLSASSDGGAPGFSLQIDNPLRADIQLPGLPQPRAPIRIDLTSAAFALTASDAVQGELSLTGDFTLHPIEPPASIPIAESLRNLIPVHALSAQTGHSTLTLAFEGDQARLAVSCAFTSAEIEVRIFDMLAQLAGGLGAPGLDPGAGVPIDAEIGFGFKQVDLTLGALPGDGADAPRLAFQVMLELTFLGLPHEVFLRLSDQELAFGLAELRVPLQLPLFPLTEDDIVQWQARESQWRSRVADLESWIDDLESVLADPVALSASSGVDAATQAYRIEQELQGLRRELHETTVALLTLQSILLIGNAVAAGNRATYQDLARQMVGFIRSATQITHFDSDLEFVVEDIQFRIPFADPRSLGLSGSAHLAGFADDDPFKPLEQLSFTLGLSPELIYFALEGGPDPIPLPDFGRYPGGSVNLDRITFGYGYTRNAFAIGAAGQLRLPPRLIEDIDTSSRLGFGIRPPAQTTLGFRFEAIPVTLGPVDFVIPLFEFDLDLRAPDSQPLARTDRCTPHWDGLQTIVPGVYHDGFKRLAFSPLFSGLPCPNLRFDGDLEVGDEHNGLTLVADDFLFLAGFVVSSSAIMPIQFFASPTEPFFDNLCINLRVAGFGINFDLQRPFPSISPLAVFEVLGLIADPMMPVDPDGALANTVRITLRDARITLPPALLKLFPEAGAVVHKTFELTLNLGTVISLVQAAVPALEQFAEVLDRGIGDIQARLNTLIRHPPEFDLDGLLAALPPELKKLRMSGVFAGFEARAVVVLVTPGGARAEMRRRETPAAAGSVFQPILGQLVDPGDMSGYRLNTPGADGRVFDPGDPRNSLFTGIEFAGFEETDLAAVAGTSGGRGVAVGAHVKVFGGQRYRFLGFVYDDGRFALASPAAIEPLRLEVAGIEISLPLAVEGRMSLAGRAKRDGVVGRITAAGNARWNVIPGIARLEISGAELKLHSNGQFALKADKCTGRLFDSLAMAVHHVDISHSHCFADVLVDYSGGWRNGHAIVQASVAGQARFGPGRQFRLAGSGLLQILGNPLTGVRAEITEHGAFFEASLDQWRLGNATLDSNSVTMHLSGQVDLRKKLHPAFRLEGEAELKSILGARLSGRGGIVSRYDAHRNQDVVRVFAEGRLNWQGRDWLDGRIALGTDGVLVSGRVSYPIDLTPPTLNNQTVSRLFLRIEIAGEFHLHASQSGGSIAWSLQKWNLGIDWLLAWKTGGEKSQIVPLAANGFATGLTSTLEFELVDVANFKLLPFSPSLTDLGQLSITIPTLEPQGNIVARLGTKDGNIAGYWSGMTAELFGGLVPRVHTGNQIDDVKVELHESYEAGTETITLNQVLNQFNVRLAWHNNKLALLINDQPWYLENVFA